MLRHGRLAVASAAVAALAGGAALGGAVSAGSRSARTYLALGDSLAIGIQPDRDGRHHATAEGYADRVAAGLAARGRPVRLVKAGRGGETTELLLRGWRDGRRSQLEEAEEALRAGGSASLVTIDIGANEIESCATATGFARACLSQGFAEVRRDLPRALRRLRAAAGPRATIVGTTYYNYFLAGWLRGGAARARALASVAVEHVMNRALSRIYRASGARVADVERAFSSTDLRSRVRFRGRSVPRAVAVVCHWTWSCDRPDDHANAAGYRVIARTVLAQVR